jgi:hypothetical protein
MRLKDKVAVIIGAGQSAGETLGNGRATVLRYSHKKVLGSSRSTAISLPLMRQRLSPAPRAANV